MPALQVRDFPQELYEELRSYSAAHHRSMAQQTVAAVDAMLHGTEGLPVAPSANGSARIEKRNQILQRAAQRREARRQDVPLPAEMLRAARAERDGDFDLLAQEYLVPAR